jgi:hypothetical protein
LGLLAATEALIERLNKMSKARSRDMRITRLGKSVAPPRFLTTCPLGVAHDHPVR